MGFELERKREVFGTIRVFIYALDVNVLDFLHTINFKPSEIFFTLNGIALVLLPDLSRYVKTPDDRFNSQCLIENFDIMIPNPPFYFFFSVP